MDGSSSSPYSLGPVMLVGAVLPGRLEAGFGRILLIGPDSGKAGMLGDANVLRCPDRLYGLGKSVARETARQDVTISVVPQAL